MLKVLEERQVPSTLTVTSGVASGPGSLPTILDQANTDAGLGKSDTITFAAGLKNKTIRLQGLLFVPAGTGTVLGHEQSALQGSRAGERCKSLPWWRITGR
jgi:hypothetical protein